MSQQHWRDRAITVSEAISDAFEVLKAYGARIAEWVLFFCLIANIIEIFPLPEPFANVFGNIVLGIQSVTLDVAGFGLTSMGAHARRRGDEKAANKASAMGWTLIGIMIVTVSLVTVSLIIPDTKPTIDTIGKVLILARVIVTVFYGHIVHSLRVAGTEHDNRIAELEKEVSTRKAEVSSVQLQLSNAQKQVSTGQQEMDRWRSQLDTLRGQLDIKQQEIESLHTALNSGHDFQASRVSSLQQEVEHEQATQAALRRELYAAKAELERVQLALSTEQHTVSSLRRELSTVQRQVSSQGVQSPAKKVSSGQADGQSKVVQLDSRRRTGQDDTEDQIRALHKVTPVQSLSARAIAGQIGCSPTTAAKWKTVIENEEKSAVNE